MTGKRKSFHVLSVGLLLIVLAGVGLRLVKLGSLPPGLYQDEAFNGLDALDILDGNPALYFPENNGREPLFFYMMAGTVTLFGRTPLGVRAAAAVFGLLTLAAAYWLGQTWRGQRAGLLAAAILAGMLWHVQLSRIGFRAVALPLFTALTLALGAAGCARRSRWWMIGAGLACGLSFYTYLAAQATPLALVAMLLYAFIWQRAWLKDHWRLLLWAGGVAAITLLPFAILFATQPDLLTARAGQVAVWQTAEGSAFEAILQNALRAVGMFVWRGDAQWRHNLPPRPVFDPLMAAVFVAGVGWGLARWRKRPALTLCLIWVGAMLLPTILASKAPHFLRAVGVLPLAALIPALALDEGIERLAERGPLSAWLGAGGALAVVGLSAGLTAQAYFGRYAASSEPAYAFQEQAVVLADALNAAEEPVRVTGRLWDTFRAIRFLSPPKGNVRYYTDGDVLEPLDPPFSLYAWPYDGLVEALNIVPEDVRVTVEAGPESRSTDEEIDTYPIWVAWHVEPLESAPTSPVARFDGAGLALVAAEASRAGGQVDVRLAWRIDGALPDPPPQMFVHVLGPDGAVITQADAPPGGTFYPPPRWTAGSVVVQPLHLTVPAGADFIVTTGLYQRDGGDRYPPVTDREVISNSVVLLP